MKEKTSEIIILWIMTGAAVALMLLRLAMRWNRLHRLEMGDYITIAAILAVLLRTSVEHAAMVLGNNQVHHGHHHVHHFTPAEISRRELGAKLTMVNRAMYTVYIWLQKCVVMCIIQHLLTGLELYTILNVGWGTLALTFIASLVVCFTECSPFELYWQVVPDPGKCARGSVQLLVFSILEMGTDVMLMVLPLRHLVKVQRPLMAKLRLIVLFLVGITIIAVTLTRLLMNRFKFHRAGASHNVANVEIFFSAFVANSPPIYGFLNMKYGSSARRYGSNSNQHASKTVGGDQQLDTLKSASTLSKRQNQQIRHWSRQQNEDTDSSEELILQVN